MASLSAWRVVSARHAATALDGEGARLFGGRWNSRGTAVVYLSEHQSLAALEILVHVRPLLPRTRYVALRLEFGEELVERLPGAALPEDWQQSPAGPSTRDLGDAWVRAARSPLLAVPSVLLPAETNYVLNPAHPDFGRINVGPPRDFTFDPRLLGR